MDKIFSRKLISVIFIISILQACATAHHHSIPVEGVTTLTPKPGHALVIFMRPGTFVGGAIQTPVFDDRKYLGTISRGNKLAYQAKPGKHMFVLAHTGDINPGDLMQATLTEGKTYYVLLTVRFGGFDFKPLNKPLPMDKIKSWLDSTILIKPNEHGYAWAVENKPDLDRKYQRNLKNWNETSEGQRKTLFADSGI